MCPAKRDGREDAHSVRIRPALRGGVRFLEEVSPPAPPRECANLKVRSACAEWGALSKRVCLPAHEGALFKRLSREAGRARRGVGAVAEKFKGGFMKHGAIPALADL